MSMKKLSIIAALLFAFGTVAFANDKPKKRKKKVKKLSPPNEEK